MSGTKRAFVSKSKVALLPIILCLSLLLNACEEALPLPGDGYSASGARETAQENFNNYFSGAGNSTSDTLTVVQEDGAYIDIATQNIESLSVIFVAEGMEHQAYVRAGVYAENYGTATAVRIISSADNFIEQWNTTFALFNAQGIAIDAIEIISHGESDWGPIGKDSDGTAYATGCLYFESPQTKVRTNVYARDVSNMPIGDCSLSGINIRVNAKRFDVDSCNSANPDIYNIVYGFMQITSVKIYSGWDGGTEWEPKIKDFKRGGGEYGTTWRHPIDPTYYVSEYQGTYWRYVEKNPDGSPARERAGRRVFESN